MKHHLHHMAVCLFAALVLTSCADDEIVNSQSIPEQPEQLAELIEGYNTNISAYQAMMAGEVEIIDYTSSGNGNYKLQLSNQLIVDAYAQTAEDKEIPLLGIDEEGYWNYRQSEISHLLTDQQGNPAPALRKTGKGVLTPKITLSEDGYWQVSYNGFQWKRLNDKPASALAGKAEANFSLYRSVALDEKTNTITLVSRISESILSLNTSNNGTTQAWKKFLMNSEDNVLLDYSYAGYHHGETAPRDGFSLGYEVKNVKQRMTAKAMTAREALIDILEEKNMTRKGGKNGHNPNARIVIYFPEGEYVLHNEDDNGMRDPVAGQTYATDSKGNNTSYGIPITGGHFVIKGDGADKTKLIMETPNLPGSKEVMYSSPCLLEIKHNSGLKKLCNVTTDALKGSHTVEVSDVATLNIGDWVCLYLKNNDPELVNKELAPYGVEESMTNIKEEGVQVQDFHQIIAKNGNRITFKEPIMHEVEARWGWEIHQYSHYEEVGIEDLAFVGHAVDDFLHHGNSNINRGWIDDGAYKPVSMVRLTNSWMRRVTFTSVSEANSITNSANVSAYNITIEGNRGHSAIRSAGSSRVFIGKVSDRTNGLLIEDRKTRKEGAGQYHACGVSKPSMGAVIWRVHWGMDACFESHATQPRATLIDACKGGFMQFRQGGDYVQLPNHLADLTIWNMYSELSRSASGNSAPAGVFDWWRIGFKGWKFLPPIVVGFHGDPMTFVTDQMKLNESYGTKVEPESLYEAQLEHRLGYLPAWLQEMK